MYTETTTLTDRSNSPLGHIYII